MKKSLILGYINLILIFPSIALCQQQLSEDEGYTDIIYSFNQRVQNLEFNQTNIFEQLEQTSNQLNLYKDRSTEIFEKIVNRLEQLQIENDELRERLNRLDSNPVP